jgi:hypothetical protein
MLLELDKEPEMRLTARFISYTSKITVNQRSTTVEDAEQARRRFLEGGRERERGKEMFY